MINDNNCIYCDDGTELPLSQHHGSAVSCVQRRNKSRQRGEDTAAIGDGSTYTSWYYNNERLFVPLFSGNPTNYNFFASLSISLSIYLSISLCHSLSELHVEDKSMDSVLESVRFVTDRLLKLVVSCGRCHFHVERICDGQNTNKKRLLPSVK
jgi:hypothetical protein